MTNEELQRENAELRALVADAARVLEPFHAQVEKANEHHLNSSLPFVKAHALHDHLAAVGAGQETDIHGDCGLKIQNLLGVVESSNAAARRRDERIKVLEERYRWRPISEIHEDYGDCVLVNINTDCGNLQVGSNLNLDFDESEWTHFTRFASIGQVEYERMRDDAALAAPKAEPLTRSKYPRIKAGESIARTPEWRENAGNLSKEPCKRCFGEGILVTDHGNYTQPCPDCTKGGE